MTERNIRIEVQMHILVVVSFLNLVTQSFTQLQNKKVDKNYNKHKLFMTSSPMWLK